jgi:hypothetical protein
MFSMLRESLESFFGCHVPRTGSPQPPNFDKRKGGRLAGDRLMASDEKYSQGPAQKLSFSPN